MATHAVIARPHPHTTERWNGVYVHKDGHPTRVGKFLFAQIVTRFNADVEAAAEHYIDHHPCGWSVVEEAFGANECYCHDHGEKDVTAHEDETGAPDMDWTYVLRPAGLEIRRRDRGVVAVVRWNADRVDWEGIEDLAERMAT